MSFVLYFYSQSIQAPSEWRGPANMISHFLISSLMAFSLPGVCLFSSLALGSVQCGCERRKNHKNDDGSLFFISSLVSLRCDAVE